MKRKYIILLTSCLILIGTGIIGYKGYEIIKKPNLKQDMTLYIPTGADFAQVMDSLRVHNALESEDGIEWVADRKNYVSRVKPGKYFLPAGLSNEELINALRSGEQQAVKVTFNNIRRLPALAAQLSKHVEPTEEEIFKILQDGSFHNEMGYTSEAFPAAFVPNTYEVWWNTSARDLVVKVIKQSERFWTKKRLEKAKGWGLTKAEIATIASIVQEETIKMDDAPRIAGVYLNRVRIGMPLQADPTIKFAMNADTVKRILDKDKEFESPYNTYKYYGLPPGPINVPEPDYLDAVLNGEKHKYLYFCANADMSGYSVFAKSYGEHLRNARRYQNALNKMKIYR